jgi:RNA polymerase sigma-70 factor (ECF subfamily)
VKRQIRKRADAVVLAKESISDLIQSISLELIKENQEFEYRGDAEFKAWLKQCISSKVIDKYRFYTAQKRDAREERMMPTAGGPISNTPSQFAIRGEDRELVTKAMQRIPGEYQEVLRMFWFEGLRHSEIAERMGRQEAAARKLLSRAKAKLGMVIEQLKTEPG